MIVIKFFQDTYYYAIAAKTVEEASNFYKEEISSEFDKQEEIPNSEFDKKFIKIHEDNNFSKKPYKVSINDVVVGVEPQLVFTNDMSFID